MARSKFVRVHPQDPVADATEIPDEQSGQIDDPDQDAAGRDQLKAGSLAMSLDEHVSPDQPRSRYMRGRLFPPGWDR